MVWRASNVISRIRSMFIVYVNLVVIQSSYLQLWALGHGWLLSQSLVGKKCILPREARACLPHSPPALGSRQMHVHS